MFHQVFQCLQYLLLENKHGVYRGKDSMKKFCEFIRACNENN